MPYKLLHKGALVSLGCAATIIFGFVLLFTQLMPYIDLQHSPEKAVQYVLEHHAMLSLWNFVIYVLFGVSLAILVIVLHWQLSPVQSLLTQPGSVMGLVWVSLVIASGMLASVVSIIGIIGVVAGVVSAVPPLSELGALFGLLLIVWFIYLSIVMMREAASTYDNKSGGML